MVAIVTIYLLKEKYLKKSTEKQFENSTEKKLNLINSNVSTHKKDDEEIFLNDQDEYIYIEIVFYVEVDMRRLNNYSTD